MLTTTTAPAPASPRPRRTRLLAGGLVLAVLAAVGLAAGTIPRLNRERAVRDQSASDAARR
jgi:hypothetical protein